LTHPATKLSKTSLRLDVFVCYAYVVKRMKFKTNVYGFMYPHKDMNVNKFRIPTTKHFNKGRKCEAFKGVNFLVYGWGMQRNWAVK